MRKFAALLLFVAANAFAEPPSIESLFRLPQFAAMRISPDGSSIAALAPVAGRQNVVILDTRTRKPFPVTGFTDRDIVEVRWVNSKRLLVRTGTLNTRESDYRGGGLYAIDKDGADGRMISEGGSDEQASTGARLVGRTLIPVRDLPGESDDMIARELVFATEGAHAGAGHEDSHLGSPVGGGGKEKARGAVAPRARELLTAW